MPEWCHTFDFTSSNHNWTIYNSGSPHPYGRYVSGSGYEDTDSDPGIILIERILPQPTVITSLKLIASTPCPIGGTWRFELVSSVGNLPLSGGWGQSTFTQTNPSGWGNIGKIRVALDTNRSGSSNPAWPGFLHTVEIQGTGENPFSTAVQPQQTLDDAFTLLRNTLQATPEADLTSQIDAYKTAIQNAFGVTFEVESGAPENWGAVSLHFARQGLEATARAFENWVTAELGQQGLCKTIDRFDLFKRIMGSMILRNVPETQIHIANATGHTIRAFQRPATIPDKLECVKEADDQNPEQILGLIDETQDCETCPPGTDWCRQAYQRDGSGNLIPNGRQGIMTPNNLIHELGHALDGFAGFGSKVIGSIQNAIDNPSMGGGASLHNDYSRKGMGEEHLQTQYYEHAKIEMDSGNTAKFTVLSIAPARIPSYPVPEQYLLFDLFDDTKYALWQLPMYADHYGSNTRIDTFGINTAIDPTETTADAFLSWVRTAFQPDTFGQNWQQFFSTNIGIFLRNAVIWQQGMIAYYQSVYLIPESPTDTGSKANSRLLRLTPVEPLNNDNIIGSSSALLPDNVEIFSWNTPSVPISDGSPYWLLVGDVENRLVWVASNGINHNVGLVTSSPQIDASQITPNRAFSGSDINIIIGE